MLVLSLHQFMYLSVTVDDMIAEKRFEIEDFEKIKLFIGDPDKDGGVSFDVTYPKYYIAPE